MEHYDTLPFPDLFPEEAEPGRISRHEASKIVHEWKHGKDSQADFKNLQIPVIRKVIPSLMAVEMVSIQPMSIPGRLAFYNEVDAYEKFCTGGQTKWVPR